MNEQERKAVHYICRGFRAALPVRRLLDLCHLHYKDHGWFKACVQEAVIAGTVHYQGKALGEWSDDAAYDAKFLRLYLKEAEERLGAGGELDEGLVMLAAECCRNGKGGRDDGCGRELMRWVEYEIGEGRRGTFRVSNAVSDIGKRVWEAGLRMFDAMLMDGGRVWKDVKGKRILEIGSGCIGLIAFAAERIGVKKVVLTDLDDEVDVLKGNLMRNGIEVGDILGETLTSVKVLDVESCEIDWSEFGDIETILAADVTYDPSLLRGVVRTCRNALDRIDSCSTIHLFVTKRSDTIHHELMKELKCSFCVEEISSDLSGLPSAPTFEYLSPAVHLSFDNVRAYRLTTLQ